MPPSPRPLRSSPAPRSVSTCPLLRPHLPSPFSAAPSRPKRMHGLKHASRFRFFGRVDGFRESCCRCFAGSRSSACNHDTCNHDVCNHDACNHHVLAVIWHAPSARDQQLPLLPRLEAPPGFVTLHLRSGLADWQACNQYVQSDVISLARPCSPSYALSPIVRLKPSQPCCPACSRFQRLCAFLIWQAERSASTLGTQLGCFPYLAAL